MTASKNPTRDEIVADRQNQLDAFRKSMEASKSIEATAAFALAIHVLEKLFDALDSFIESKSAHATQSDKIACFVETIAPSAFALAVCAMTARATADASGAVMAFCNAFSDAIEPLLCEASSDDDEDAPRHG
jgi:hypothetical protein